MKPNEKLLILRKEEKRFIFIYKFLKISIDHKLQKALRWKNSYFL